MESWNLKLLSAVFGALLLLGTGSLSAGTLSFSKPEPLITLPWSDNSKHGVSPQGPEWFLVDPQGRLLFQSSNDFDLYSPQGRYLQSYIPIDKSINFYGFTSLEFLSNGNLALLARLESPLEQRNKDNFEERARPGARLIVLAADGKVKLDKEIRDPDQPHSGYYLLGGVVYSVHEDGSYGVLDKADPQATEDKSFKDFAAIADSPTRWEDHLKKLPVFHAKNRIYHDIQGKVHQVEGALAFLMGRPYVEGRGAVAQRKGKTYFQVLSQRERDFVDAVFVEDRKKGNYGFVELVPADADLEMAHPHALFVDKKGNLYEGVGKKDGYHLYKWTTLP